MKESDGEVMFLFVMLTLITGFLIGLWTMFQVSVWLPVTYCVISIFAMALSLHLSHTDKDWDNSDRANIVAGITAVTLGMYWPLFCIWVLVKYTVYMYERHRLRAARTVYEEEFRVYRNEKLKERQENADDSHD